MFKSSANKKFIGILLIALAFIVFDVALNYTLYNPAFITPLYGFFFNRNLISTHETAGYPLVSIRTINNSLFPGPRASVVGKVEDVQQSADGDWHIDIRDSDGVLVAEMVPEYPLPIPKVGDTIKIWGITRYDMSHRWWELHPVFGWQKIN